jgi:hypothetical protein
MATPLWTWWSLLCAVGLINVMPWSDSATLLRRKSLIFEPTTWDLIRVQIIFSAGYVFGCRYRSVLSVFDIKHLCLIVSWLSSVVIRRSVATIAQTNEHLRAQGPN